MSKVKRGHEAGDAKLLDHFEQINLSVELFDAILKDSFVLLEFAALLWAAALAPACAEEPVKAVPTLSPAVPMVRVAEDCPVLDRFLQLVLLIGFIRKALCLVFSSAFLHVLPHRKYFLDQ